MKKQIALASSVLAILCQFGRADELADLQAQRVLACERAVELAFRRYQAGADTLSQTLEMQEQLGEAKLELSPTRAQRIAVLIELVEAITDLEKLAERKFKAGQVGELEVVAVKAARLRACASPSCTAMRMNGATIGTATSRSKQAAQVRLPETPASFAPKTVTTSDRV